MRIGLIGAGRIGRFHARILAGLVEEVWVADTDSGRARQLVSDLGLSGTKEVPALIASCDALVVAAATPAHAELVMAGVDAGIPVFCEKPIALDLPTTRRVLDHVRAGEGRVQMGFQRRFDEGYLAARDLVRSGRVGTLLYLRLAGHDPAPPSEGYIAESGGIFRDFAVHDFDILRFVTGEEVVEVYAAGSVREFPVFALHDDVDTAVAVLTLESGALAITGNTRSHPLGYDVRMEIYGTEDSAVAGWDQATPLRSLEGGGPAVPAHPHAGFLMRFRQAYRAELSAFVDMVVEGRDSEVCTVEDAERSLAVASACEISRAERRPVQLTELF